MSGPYTEADFAKIQPIDPSMTVGELVDRLRDEFHLADHNQFVKDGVAENLVWLPPFNMPIDSIDNPAGAMTTRAVLQAPAAVRVAVALLLRDVIMPSLTEMTEAGSQKRRKSKAGV